MSVIFAKKRAGSKLLATWPTSSQRADLLLTKDEARRIAANTEAAGAVEKALPKRGGTNEQIIGVKYQLFYV